VSEPEPQAPQTPEFFEAPIYTREELEERLRRLQEKLDYISERLSEALSALDEIYATLQREPAVTTKTLWRVVACDLDVESTVKDAVDEMVVNELKLDTDIEKYEEHFNVEFRHGEERQLGVALLKEGGRVKPVVVWTDYQEIGYYEGEKSE
jgi:hypothetical protein